ncbi:cyclin [Plasmodium sp. gorilla clade G2]|uniref:cyclin n=1 Tax=Plasmodium sp. gorilla clade G2 TaxID=880535 RepID=UPI000D224EBE|nr:cyclin [Plasmodium sp. gorilla clade G2]SOV11753.1 cyclin [Plasmodium sp. gorilla clade G2]
MDYEIEGEVPRTDKNYIFLYIPIVLNEMIKNNNNKGVGKITSFHASKIPDISLKNYIERIGKYIGCSNECFVLLIIYLDRLIKIHQDISLSLLCIHRLVITAAMISIKFFDDLYYSNAYYAKIGGVTTKELNKLEIYFLNLIDYHLFVSSQEYDYYRKYISLAVTKYIYNKNNIKHIPIIKKPYNLFNYKSTNNSTLMFQPKNQKINIINSIETKKNNNNNNNKNNNKNKNKKYNPQNDQHKNE